MHVTRENVSQEPHEEPVDLSGAFEGMLSALPNHLRRDSTPARASMNDIDQRGQHERRPILVSAASTFTEEQEVMDTKRGDRHGLSEEAWRLIRWKSGRAGIKAYVQDDIDESQGDMGVVGACLQSRGRGRCMLTCLVCGPSALLEDAAKAVREVGTATAVWNGQPTIDFYRDSFGW